MTATKVVLSGRGLLESPRWHDGRLYVSDWSAGEVVAVDPDGTQQVVATVPSLPLCTAWTPEGRLLLVDSPRGRLLRLEPNGTLVPHAELGRPGRWNDIVVDGRGHAYVDAIGFDPMAGEPVRPGSVFLVSFDGRVSEQAGVDDDIAFPNGMAVTADNQTLIVADSYRHQLVAFDIDARGELSGRRVWAQVDDAAPDGICIDADGAVWYADVPHQCCTRVAEGGRVLRTVELDRGGFACVLGGPSGTTLFIAAAKWRGMGEDGLVVPASGQVISVEVDVAGAGWP